MKNYFLDREKLLIIAQDICHHFNTALLTYPAPEAEAEINLLYDIMKTIQVQFPFVHFDLEFDDAWDDTLMICYLD